VFWKCLKILETLTESSVNPAKFLESGRIWDEDDFKHENHFYENSPTHLISKIFSG